MKRNTAYHFIALGFGCLLVSISLGLTASLQYIFPNLSSERFSFQQTRPLHVFLAISWIFSCVTGIIYHYMPSVAGRALYSPKIATWHFLLSLGTIFVAIAGFFAGIFSGREYLEFPPWLSVVIVIYWLLFCINFLLTVKPNLAQAPVYIWSWCTGLLFFLITITEAHLWLLPYFNNNLIRDLTVQWKANGSMVGAWNMLIYGTAMFAMEHISGNNRVGYQKTSFAFYFLGLTNLMFNWGHHTYVVPAHPVIKEVSYIISMTELILLANIIMKWKKGLSSTLQSKHTAAIRFFKSADRWILLNLVLAIAISVPGINRYTHGTQITVAHAMGTTIGINTTLLLGSVAFILAPYLSVAAERRAILGLQIMNVSLLLFWLSLIGVGVTRSIGVVHGEHFSNIANKSLPYFKALSIFGALLFSGITLIAFSYLKIIAKASKRNTHS